MPKTYLGGNFLGYLNLQRLMGPAVHALVLLFTITPEIYLYYVVLWAKLKSQGSLVSGGLSG